MWDLDHKESWVLENWCLFLQMLFVFVCFFTAVLEKMLKSPLDCKEIKPVNPKEVSPDYSLESLMLQLRFNTLASSKKILMLGKTEGRRRSWGHSMRWLDGITNLMEIRLSKVWIWVMEREAWPAAVHGIAKTQTWLSTWSELNWNQFYNKC